MVPVLAGARVLPAGASEAPVWGLGSRGFRLSRDGALLRGRPVLCVPRMLR